ncbi:MAG: glycosyltransferase [bacterium]|nr:glycosyltransferase [bacterium]
MIKSYQGSDLPFDLYIFGKGSYENELLELGNQFSQIHFFGWKALEEVQRYLSNIDYCLMPSKCLETFGLSAINVLQWGIPVV